MINNATEREKNQFGDKFVEKLILRIAHIPHRQIARGRSR